MKDFRLYKIKELIVMKNLMYVISFFNQARFALSLTRYLRVNSKRYVLFTMCIYSFFCVVAQSLPIETKIPERPSGQKDVIELRTEPIPNVRIAIIGLGKRGIGAVYRLSKIETAKIVAICDLQQRYIDRAVSKLDYSVDTYTKEDDWKRICERKDVDLVYVCTHWDLHTPIAVYAMEHGKHVALEVPAALTMEECWSLVDTAERTQRHCMMLENCNYDFFELTTLNMAQKGLFGEVIHAEGAYIHDLRAILFEDGNYWKNWRLKHNALNIGNLYPTHGLGPIAHAMNIHRGDKMNYLVTVSTNQFSMTEFAKKKFGEDSDQAKAEYKHGDMNTTLIRTENGKNILIQHNIVTPRPYSRLHSLTGTKGFAQKYPVESLAFEPNAHSFLDENKKDSLLRVYEHPIIKDIKLKAKKIGGHGGMDFIMDYRLIYCLNNGLPLDMDVYDCVEWSCLVPLSRLSLENNSAPVKIPDFTRGAWKKVDKVTYYMK